MLDRGLFRLLDLDCPMLPTGQNTKIHVYVGILVMVKLLLKLFEEI
jgi:hypothetical protein